MDLERIPLFNRAGDTLNAIVETPRGSRNKYWHDPATGEVAFDKALGKGNTFPFDFGFFPHTKGEDGDPLDVLVLIDEPVFPGCVVECRVIGVLRALQTAKGRTVRNDRFIAVAEESTEFEDVRDVGDLPARAVREITHFFVSYNELEGRKFKPGRVLGRREARKLLEPFAAGRETAKTR